LELEEETREQRKKSAEEGWSGWFTMSDLEREKWMKRERENEKEREREK
jgi:hypothetical protein